MLIDEFLPVFDVHEVHETRIVASPEHVLEAVRAVTPREIALFRFLMGLRSLPARLFGQWAPDPSADVPVVDVALRGGFVRLGEEPGREIVLGVVGRFWTVTGDRRHDLGGAEGFVSFREPGYAKAAVNFRAEPEGGGTRLTTETRIAGTDAGGRRRFRAYWAVVHPGSALIRRTWLAAVRRRAERGTMGFRV